MASRPIAELQEALDRGDHETVLRETETMLAARPGDDAAHELRARALLALGRREEAEAAAAAAVRLDPDEVRYRELLAEVLAAEGAHRDAAAEYARLASQDPRQPAWIVAEAEERLSDAQADAAVDAARRAVRLDPANGEAQLALAQALVRSGDARGGLQAATAAVELRPGDPAPIEALADAQWLAGNAAVAFDAFRDLAADAEPGRRARLVRKARRLYRSRAGWLGRLLAAAGPLFTFAFGRGWLSVR